MSQLRENYGFQNQRSESERIHQNGYYHSRSQQVDHGSRRIPQSFPSSYPKNSRSTSPSRRWSPSPRRRRTPSPRRRRTPSPHKRTPSPRRRRTPSPLNTNVREQSYSRPLKRTYSPHEYEEKISKKAKVDYSKYNDIAVETSGRAVPNPIEKFDDINLGKRILENIRSVGYDCPTPVQKYSIPIVLKQRDLMACAQTGSGKTAAFLLPILSSLVRDPPLPSRQGYKIHPTALVLAPTRELACQIQEECLKFGSRTGLKSIVVYGGASIIIQMRNLESGCDILVATPGRLSDLIQRGKVGLSHIKFLVLDEADRMLDMGFEPQIRKIVEQSDMTKKGDRRTLMFSATFPREIQQLASSFLEDYIFLAIGKVGSTTELVTQKFIKVDATQKFQVLLDLLTNRSHKGLTLIFVERRKSAESLANFLISKRIPATSIHGNRSQKERTLAIQSFSKGVTPILVATNVAARGLDIDDIDHVINFDMPTDIDDYVHRIGRTGRAGKEGLSTSLITKGDENLADKLIQILLESHQEVPPFLYEMKERNFSLKRGGSGRSFHHQASHGGHGPRYGGRDFRFEHQPQKSFAPPPPPGSGYPPRPHYYPPPPPPVQPPANSWNYPRYPY